MKEFKPYIIEGFQLNPNEKVVNAIVKRLDKTEGHCPCNNIDHGTDLDICPCRHYREDKVCCCNLYVKKLTKD